MAKRRRKLTAKQIAAGFGGKRRRSRKHRAKRRHTVRATVRRVRRHRRRAGGKRTPHMGYTIGSRRIRRLKLNPRHRRRHRNPISVRGITGQITSAGMGALGGVALDVSLGYLTPMLPAALTTGYVKHATRIGAALGLGYLSKKFLGGKGDAVAKGALVVAMYGLLKDVIVQFAPSVPGLGDYEEVTLDTSGMGAYITGPHNMGAYLPDGSHAPGMGAYLNGGAYVDNSPVVAGVDY